MFWSITLEETALEERKNTTLETWFWAKNADGRMSLPCRVNKLAIIIWWHRQWPIRWWSTAAQCLALVQASERRQFSPLSIPPTFYAAYQCTALLWLAPKPLSICSVGYLVRPGKIEFVNAWCVFRLKSLSLTAFNVCVTRRIRRAIHALLSFSKLLTTHRTWAHSVRLHFNRLSSSNWLRSGASRRTRA